MAHAFLMTSDNQATHN